MPNSSSRSGMQLSAFTKNPLLPIGIAFSSGILMALATAPLNAFPLAWVALAPLWIMTLGDRPSQNPYILALAWGIGYHGLALSWITGLHPLTWLGMSWFASVAVTLFCWAFITLWGAALVVIWVWLTRRLDRRQKAEGRRQRAEGRGQKAEGRRQKANSDTHHPTPDTRHLFQILTRILIATAIWCGLEWLWSLGSLYWTSLSYTQSPGNLIILHLGQLSGPAMVTAAIVAVNGLLAEAWLSYWNLGVSHIETHSVRAGLTEQSSTARPFGKNRPYMTLKILLSVAILLLGGLHLIGFGLYSQPLSQPEDTALKVGIVQGNVPTRIKLSANGVRRAIDGYTSGYKLLADQGVDAVLTPEGALPILWDESYKQKNTFYQAVINKGVAAWLGTFVTENGRITQSLLSLMGTGETVGRFNKIKLVPLGEYVPFRDVLGGLINRLSPIEADMLPGTNDQRFNTPFGRAIASICYESAFPAQFRAQAADGGQFILTASNLDPYSEVLMAQHQAQDLMRAIETDRWAVRATNTGYSGIIDPHGRIIWRSQPRIYETHADTIFRRQSQTPYVRWGDWLTPLLITASATLVIIRIIKTSNPPRNPQI